MADETKKDYLVFYFASIPQQAGSNIESILDSVSKSVAETETLKKEKKEFIYKSILLYLWHIPLRKERKIIMSWMNWGW